VEGERSPAPASLEPAQQSTPPASVPVLLNQRSITVSVPGGPARVRVKFWVDRETLGGTTVPLYITVEAELTSNPGKGISDALTYTPSAPIGANRQVAGKVEAFVKLSIADLSIKINADRLYDLVTTGNLPDFFEAAITYKLPVINVGAKLGVKLGWEGGEFTVKPVFSGAYGTSISAPEVGLNGGASFVVQIPRNAAAFFFVPIPFFTRVWGGPSLPGGGHTPELPPAGGSKHKSKGESDGASPNAALFEIDPGSELGELPIPAKAPTFFDALESGRFSIYEGARLPLFKLSDLGVAASILDRGVNFQDIRFSGFALDSASGAPFFRVDFTPALPGSGIPGSTLDERLRRFRTYFIEGLALSEANYRVSVESTTDAAGTRQAVLRLPEPLLDSYAARVMVDHDITMKRTFLAEIVRGQEDTVNDGVVRMWFDILHQSPFYGTWLQRGQLPAINVNVRAVIVGGTVRVTRREDGAYRIIEAPLDIQWAIEELSPVATGFPAAELADLNVRIASLRAALGERIAQRVPGFVDVLNQSAAYEELRLVYAAFAQAKLYKLLAPSLPAVPYVEIYNKNQIPVDRRPPDPFPAEAFIARATTTAGTERATAPCGTLPTGETSCPDGEFRYEIFGGVEWVDEKRVEHPTQTAEEWAPTAASLDGHFSGAGASTASAGTVIGTRLPEYTVQLGPADGPGDPYKVIMSNVGNRRPEQHYVLIDEVVNDRLGRELRRTRVRTILSTDTAPPAGARTYRFPCAACAVKVDGEARRWLEARVFIGRLQGGTFEMEPELNPRDNAASLTLLPVDLVWREPSGGQVTWSILGASLLSWRAIEPAVGAGWRIEATADMNGDGTTDYIWRHSGGDNVIWYLDAKGSFLSFDALTSVGDSNWRIEAAVDVDRDGQNDLVWRNVQSGENLVWYMAGAALRTWEMLPTVPADWALGGAGDIDGDGQPDLVWRHSGGANVIWYMQAKQGTKIEAWTNIPTVGGAWRIDAVADVDNDGLADLLWRDTASGSNAIWFMSGNQIHRFVVLETVVEDPAWTIAGVRVR
jgi:hypothetical protein